MLRVGWVFGLVQHISAFISEVLEERAVSFLLFPMSENQLDIVNSLHVI